MWFDVDAHCIGAENEGRPRHLLLYADLAAFALRAQRALCSAEFG
jgi:hypothetical protein